MLSCEEPKMHLIRMTRWKHSFLFNKAILQRTSDGPNQDDLAGNGCLSNKAIMKKTLDVPDQENLITSNFFSTRLSWHGSCQVCPIEANLTLTWYDPYGTSGKNSSRVNKRKDWSWDRNRMENRTPPQNLRFGISYITPKLHATSRCVRTGLYSIQLQMRLCD